MWQIRRLHEKQEILEFLERDRLYAAYAIGDLEPGLFEQCQWWAARAEGQIKAMALLFSGLEPPALFLIGAGAGLAPILGSALRPQRVYCSARRELLATLGAFYTLSQPETMVRMALRAQDFRPVGGWARRLSPAHSRQLQALYHLADREGERVIAFTPSQLARGVFHGVWKRSQLVAAAGTHLVAPTYGLAAVGNVFTHPDYRGRGYATLCTSLVVEELLSRGLDVVLNVGADNARAIAIYERLGFREHCRFVEVLGVRKGTGKLE